MKSLPLSSWKDLIDPTILKRGQVYFRDGAVADFEEYDKGIYQGFVDGSETYTIRIESNGVNITDVRCDCPYDMGSICKHVVAGLYALENFLQNGEYISSEVRENVKQKKKTGGGRKTIKEKLIDACKVLSPEMLREFIIEQGEGDRILRERLFRLAEPVGHTGNFEKDKKSYSSSIRSSIRASMRQGFVEWGDEATAAEGAYEILEQAEQSLEKGDFSDTWARCAAIFETIYPELQNIDDSNGEFSGILEGTEVCLQSLCERCIQDKNPLRKDLFTYLITQITNPLYDGWSMWRFFSGLAIICVDTPEEETILRKTIRGIPGDRYDATVRVELEMMLLEKVGKKEEMEKLIDANLDIDTFRHRRIREAIEGGDYRIAKGLCEEKLEGKGNWTQKVWQAYLLDIAGREKDTETMRKYLELFFIEYTEWGCYDALKKMYDASDWGSTVKRLIDTIHTKPFFQKTILLEIYRRENMWADFRRYLEEISTTTKMGVENCLDILEAWDTEIQENCSDIWSHLVLTLIDTGLVMTTGRSQYRGYTQWLRRISKREGDKEIIPYMKKWRNHYKNRKAMLEEFDEFR